MPSASLKRIWHGPCKVVGIIGNDPVKHETQEGLIMINHASSLFTQLGVGFISFVVSATCILAAVGPSHIAG